MATEPFPQPRKNPGGVPCGECHLQPGETCDVCEAVAPVPVLCVGAGGSGGSSVRCAGCGRPRELRGGFCFDCASAGERRALQRTPLQHLRQALHNLWRRKWRHARIDLAWARECLTGTGDYATHAVQDRMADALHDAGWIVCEPGGLFVPRNREEAEAVHDAVTRYLRAHPEAPPQDDAEAARRNKAASAVPVSGIWLRREGDLAVVAAEVDGRWLDVMAEHVDCNFSHIAEPGGIRKGKETKL